MRAVVRVAVKAVETLLLSSGVAGLFLRPYFTPLVDSSAHAIIWLGDSCLLQALSQAEKVPGALGLVRNWRGLGLRVPAAMLTAAHMVLHNAAPPQPKRFFLRLLASPSVWGGRGYRRFSSPRAGPRSLFDPLSAKGNGPGWPQQRQSQLPVFGRCQTMLTSTPTPRHPPS